MCNLKNIINRYNKIAINCKTKQETKQCVDILYENGYSWAYTIYKDRHYLKKPVIFFINNKNFTWGEYDYYLENDDSKIYKLIYFVILKRSNKLKFIDLVQKNKLKSL